MALDAVVELRVAAGRLLVHQHGLARRAPVLGSKGPSPCRPRRGALVAEFRHEPRRVVVVAGVVASVPDIPDVDTAVVRIVGIQLGGAGRRAARPVRTGRVELRHDLGEQPVVVVRAPRAALELRLPVPVLVAPEVLVVAVPQDERGVRRQPDHVVPGLGLELEGERFFLRVGRACQREVLPDHHAELVTRLVEGLLLVQAAAPDAEQVDSCVLGLLHALAVPLRRDAAGEGVVGDPVHATAEDLDAVDREPEGCALVVGIRRRVELDLTEAGALVDRVENARVVVERHLDVVQRLLAKTVGPPWLDVADRELDLGPVLGRDDGLARCPVAGDTYGDRAETGLTLDLDVDTEVAVPTTGGVLRGRGEDADIGDASLVPAPQPDGLPDACGDEAGAPIPAEVAGHLADEVERVLLDVDPLADQLGHLRCVLEGRTEHDFDGVGSDPDEGTHREDVAPVHVDRRADRAPVDANLSDRIQSVADQVGVVALKLDRVPGKEKGVVVAPGLLPDPVLVCLGRAYVRIREQARGHQVGVDASGNSRRDAQNERIPDPLRHRLPRRGGRVDTEDPLVSGEVQPAARYAAGLVTEAFDSHETSPLRQAWSYSY